MRLYKISLIGSSNATRREALELLKITKKSIYYRYGIACRWTKANSVTRGETIGRWQIRGLIDMAEYYDKIIIKEYSSNDMY